MSSRHDFKRRKHDGRDDVDDLKRKIKRELDSEDEQHGEREKRRDESRRTARNEEERSLRRDATKHEIRREDERSARRNEPRHRVRGEEEKSNYGNEKTTGEDVNNEKEPEEREMPNFQPSGKLTAETNTFKGVVVKYNEPAEAKICKTRWRIYPFKGTEQLPIIYVHRQSAYLIGRDRKIADFPVDHPSCSKQHAALQYRSMPYEREDGSRARRTRPYIIDLGSANGTYLNGERIEPQRYYELKEQDVLKFGFSSREYVLLKEIPEQGTSRNDDDRDPDEDEMNLLAPTNPDTDDDDND